MGGVVYDQHAIIKARTGKRKKDIHIVAIVFSILSVVLGLICWRDENQRLFYYFLKLSVLFSVELWCISIYAHIKNQRLERFLLVGINIIWWLIWVYALLLMIIIKLVLIILGIEKIDDLMEFLYVLGISLTVLLVVRVFINDLKFIEGLVNNLKAVLMRFGWSLDTDTAFWFLIFSLWKTLVDTVFYFLIKIQGEKKETFMKNTLYKVEIFFLTLLFMLFIFEMFPNFDYEKYQGKMLNVLTFFTVIIMFKDTRNKLTEETENLPTK